MRCQVVDGGPKETPHHMATQAVPVSECRFLLSDTDSKRDGVVESAMSGLV